MTEELAKHKLIEYIKERVPISENESEVITSYFELRHLPKKSFFIQEGQECIYHGFVISGTLRVFYSDPKGLEHVLYFGFADWWVGDIASFNTHEPTHINVQALEDSWILTFSKDGIEELFLKVPILERLFRIMAQRTLSVLQKRFFLTVSANAHDRYKELIERHPGIEQLVPQHQIASYLGILPESLSRMKKQLLQKK
jgi:CRP-like cAMP-binding protein